MSSITEVQKEIVSEFSECTDWQERYQLLIEMGDELGSLPDSVKTSERLVPGCQSRVWIVAEEKDGKIEFQADSDSAITRGMIALLIRVFFRTYPRRD